MNHFFVFIQCEIGVVDFTDDSQLTSSEANFSNHVYAQIDNEASLKRQKFVVFKVNNVLKLPG